MNAADLADLALDIAREAGRLALDGRADVRVADTKSSPVDVVTQMDRACERLILSRLEADRPADAFLGEEGTTGAGPVTGERSEYRWIVDPIDGTVNYLYGLPHWAVSIAVERSGETLAAAVVAPALGEEFIASAGGGSRLITEQGSAYLRCSSQTRLSLSLVGTGFGYLSGRRRHQGAVIAALLPTVRDIRRCGAAALDLCNVAAGRLDATFERGLQPWDAAAGDLIAREAGAMVGDLRGGRPNETMALAAGPGLFEQLRERLVELGADAPEERSDAGAD